MNVAAGIRLDLSSLSSRNRQALRKLMARISEASYRRGFQQGAYMALRGEADDKSASRLRHTRSLDVSPRGESYARDRGRPAVERFGMEYGDLAEVGLTGDPLRVKPLEIVRIEREALP